MDMGQPQDGQDMPGTEDMSAGVTLCLYITPDGVSVGKRPLNPDEAGAAKPARDMRDAIQQLLQMAGDATSAVLRGAYDGAQAKSGRMPPPQTQGAI